MVLVLTRMKRVFWGENANKATLISVLLGMYIVFALFIPTFFSYARIISALKYAYFLGFLAIGETFVIATGEIDFSIGPVMFTCALMAGQMLQNNIPLSVCIVACIMIGIIFGSISGYLVSNLRLPSFITSMAIMNAAKGLGSVVTRTQSVSWPQSSDAQGWYRKFVSVKASGLDIPVGFLILISVAIVCAVLFKKTYIGRYILCLGSNKEALRMSGVDVNRWGRLAYIVCGMMAGVAAIFYVGAYTTVQPGLGDVFNNDAIACCVMGGTSMSGGTASIGGTFLGVMVIALLQEGILAMGLTRDYQYIVTGIIVLLSVCLDMKNRRG